MRCIKIFNETLGNSSSVTYIGRIVLLPLFLVCIAVVFIFDIIYLCVYFLIWVWYQLKVMLGLDIDIDKI